MNATLTLWALVLGGYVLPDTDNNSIPLNEDLTPPAAYQRGGPATTPLPPSTLAITAAQGARNYDRRPMTPPGGARQGAASMPPGSLPLSPTDPLTGAAAHLPPTPTGASPYVGTGAGGVGASRAQGPFGQNTGMSGGGSNLSGGQRAAYQPFAPTQSQPLRSQEVRAPGAYFQATDQKPLNDRYRQPSAISPWMSLNRGGNNGTFDNYNTIVRPTLQQQNTNQVFGGELNGLQGAVQRQGNQIQQLNQDTGLANPQYYQYYPNYQQNYPGGVQRP